MPGSKAAGTGLSGAQEDDPSPRTLLVTHARDLSRAKRSGTALNADAAAAAVQQQQLVITGSVRHLQHNFSKRASQLRSVYGSFRHPLPAPAAAEEGDGTMRGEALMIRLRAATALLESSQGSAQPSPGSAQNQVSSGNANHHGAPGGGPLTLEVEGPVQEVNDEAALVAGGSGDEPYRSSSLCSPPAVLPILGTEGPSTSLAGLVGAAKFQEHVELLAELSGNWLPRVAQRRSQLLHRPLASIATLQYWVEHSELTASIYERLRETDRAVAAHTLLNVETAALAQLQQRLCAAADECSATGILPFPLDLRPPWLLSITAEALTAKLRRAEPVGPVFRRSCTAD
eukprot:COSAG05_NODE_4155_length_1650_cov_2.005158_1_plen_343_part_01